MKATAHAPLALPAVPEPPHNVEAEQQLLGTLLVNNEAYDRLGMDIKPEHFHEPVHGRIFAAIAQTIEAGTIANAVTLYNAFENDDGLADVGGASYLTRLPGVAISTTHVAHYAKLVRDLARARDVLVLSDDLRASAQASASDPTLAAGIPALVDAALLRFDSGARTTERAIAEVLDASWSEIERAWQGGGPVGIGSGLSYLDRLTAGFRAGELTILAARPAMGKTALGINFAVAGARAGHTAAIVSLEMRAESLTKRLIAAEALVPYSRLFSGKLSQEEADRAFLARQAIAALPVHFDDPPSLTIGELRHRARRLKRRHGIALLVVDYLQLLRPDGRHQSPVSAVTEISAGLKQIARESDLAVVALSQLSREAEKRDNRRPRLADLRESGAIEQDADKVIFLHRPSIDDPEDRPGECELTIAKNRCGRMGIVALAYHDETTQFRDLSRFDAAEAAARAFDTARDWTR